MKSQTTKTHVGSCIALCALFIFPLFLAACGSSSSTSDKASSGTGSVSFSVVWQDTASQSSVLKAAEIADNCMPLGVSRVTAQVLDENDHIIAEGPSEGWSCNVGEASITGVPVGNNRKLVVLGMDSNWDVLYRGESSRVTIKENQPNVATVILKPVKVYTITATASTGGTIYPLGTVMVNNGADRTFTITPDDGCKVTNVVVDSSEQGAITTYTFPDVDDDHTIEATFVAIWFVDGDAMSSGDGKSWAMAFATIEEAIAHASDGDEIWVKQGTYAISSTLVVSEPVEIYAGFAGTESERSQRNWETNVTTVDGSDAAGCFIVNADAVIDGFIITGSNNTDTAGGGIFNYDASPTITNCTFSGNSAEYGGGVFNNAASPTITNCIFSGNSASGEGGYGGGIFNYDASPTITNCIFSGNSASGEGGGIFNSEASPTITNCIFSGNSASGEGGGILNYLSSPTITNCTFSGNSAYYFSGGGISNIDTTATIANCILWDDTAEESDSEIYDNSGSTTIVTYCNIDQNGYAGSDGNIREDPLFGADLHLQANSPCIDNADPASAPDEDIDGEPRPQGDGYDMGADEFYDSDGDGMPDYWEIKYGLNPSADDSSLNPDGDGRINLEEYQNGTNPLDASPTANITTPQDGNIYNVGDLTFFNGTGSDTEDGNLTGDSLIWISSIDGLIGTGTDFSSNNLSAGIHTITLTATDSQGATGSHRIVININAPPEPEIITPQNDATVIRALYGNPTPISFSGTGYDPEDGDLTGDSLVWTSNIDGLIGTGTDFSSNNLSAGTHTITLTATDSQGTSVSTEITLHVFLLIG